MGGLLGMGSGCGWRGVRSGLWVFLGTPHIPLPPDESSLKMDHVAHVPQSPASHVGGQPPQEEPRADMLRPDPRDTFFLSERGPWRRGRGHPACHSVTTPPTAPRVEPSSLENVLEPCAYAPTYVVKDFPIARYQGLQFVSAPHQDLPETRTSLPGSSEPSAPPAGVPVLCLPQRSHAPHSHGDREQVLLPGVTAVLGKVGGGAQQQGMRAGPPRGRGVLADAPPPPQVWVL